MKTNIVYRKQLTAGRRLAEWITRHNTMTTVIEAAAIAFTGYYIFMFA